MAFFVIEKRAKGVIDNGFLEKLSIYEKKLRNITDFSEKEQMAIIKEIKGVAEESYNKLQESYFIPTWQSIEDMEKEFSFVKEIIKQASILIQQEKEEGLEKLQMIIEYLMKYNKIVSWTTFTEIVEDKEELVKKIPDYYTHIEKQLSELEDAFRNKDFVLISDILEYEIPEVLDSVKGLVKDVVFEE
jgi:CRISPR/Cas system CMR-associated protein Cmr5 small subunit